MGQRGGSFAFRRSEVGEVQRPVPAKSGSSTTSCRPWAATDFMGGSPVSGAETEPSGRTTRIVPPFCVTSSAPSGRNANAHAPVRPPATGWTATGGEGLAGGGRIGLSLKGGLRLRRLRPCHREQHGSDQRGQRTGRPAGHCFQHAEMITSPSQRTKDEIRHAFAPSCRGRDRWRGFSAKVSARRALFTLLSARFLYEAWP